MKNLKVSMKLIVSFMILTAFAIAAGAIGLVGMNSINKADDTLYYENVLAIAAMGNIRETFQDQRIQLRNYMVHAGNSAKIQEYHNAMLRLEGEIEGYFRDYESTIVDRSKEADYDAAKRLYQNDFSQIKKKIMDGSIIGYDEGYKELYDPHALAVSENIVHHFDEAMLFNEREARAKVDNNTALFMSMLVAAIVLLAATVGVAIFLALYISGLIGKPLEAISAFLSRAGSTGDLSLTAEDKELIDKYSKVNDEIGHTIAGSSTFINHVSTIAKELESVSDGDFSINISMLSESDTMAQSLRNMTDSFCGMFTEIRSSTNQVASGSKQIADGAQALAQGSTEQAASIQELSGTISEVAEMTKSNATTAEKASKLSEEIKVNAEKGSHQMDEMISAVKGINDASHSIGKIIKTIDDIAFQTNILALNAAVEAARAGQHGKGFAVVAEEVRNLASKSAEAAKDTGDMIQNSIERAELGSRIAGETAASLNDIVSGINQSSSLIEEIAASSEEQTLRISQINTAIDQVALVVQQNSATAQESAAASQEMSGQSDVLSQLISQFVLKNCEPESRIAPTQGGASRRQLLMPGDPVGAGAPGRQYSGDYGKY